MVIPAAYNSAKGTGNPRHNISLSFIDEKDPEVDPGTQASLLIISRGTAILLLGVYVAYLFFQVSLQDSHQRRSEFCLLTLPYYSAKDT
jgi:Ca2+:H+ antiporter